MVKLALIQFPNSMKCGLLLPYMPSCGRIDATSVSLLRKRPRQKKLKGLHCLEECRRLHAAAGRTDNPLEICELAAAQRDEFIRLIENGHWDGEREDGRTSERCNSEEPIHH